MYVCLGGFANSLMVISTKNRIEPVKRTDLEKKKLQELRIKEFWKD